ncbi:MAG: hypothetical protein GVY12_17400 [Bacteroidetes bacterium]|nr:hypothetical protein [Bacteroidota bacterium]
MASQLQTLIERQTFLRSATVELEARIDETDRVADVLLTLGPKARIGHGGVTHNRIAFEVQCTPIGQPQFAQRESDYAKAGIAVVWLLTGPKHELDRQDGSSNAQGRTDTFTIRSAATYLLQTRGVVYYVPEIGDAAHLPSASPSDVRLEVISGAADYYASRTRKQTGLLRPWTPWVRHMTEHTRKRSYSVDPAYRFCARLADMRLAQRLAAPARVQVPSSAAEENAEQSPGFTTPGVTLITGADHRRAAEQWWTRDRTCRRWPEALGPALQQLKAFGELLSTCALPMRRAEDYTYPEDDTDLPRILCGYQLPQALNVEMPINWCFGCETELWQRVIYLSLIWAPTSNAYREHFQLPQLLGRGTNIVATGYAIQALSRYLPVSSFTRQETLLVEALDQVRQTAERLVRGATHGKPPPTWEIHILRHLQIAAFFSCLARRGILMERRESDASALLEELASVLGEIRYVPDAGGDKTKATALWKRWHDLSRKLADVNPHGQQFEYEIRQVGIGPVLIN